MFVGDERALHDKENSEIIWLRKPMEQDSIPVEEGNTATTLKTSGLLDPA
jgi:hypothetical protein